MKTCTGCGEDKPLEMFSKRSDRAGRRARCIACEKARSMANSQAKRKDGMRKCTACLQEFTLASFPLRTRNGKTLPMTQCTACIKERDRVRNAQRTIPIATGRPVFYRAAVEKVCDAAMDGWRYAVEAPAVLRWAA